jgi:hypothetical protein
VNLEDRYEIEALIVGNVLNDPQHLKSIAVLPEYFFDDSFYAVMTYITEHREYNLYDMAKELGLNFELLVELSENLADKKTFQYRVLKLIDISKVRQRARDELDASFAALMNGVDPINVGQILRDNLSKLLG